MVHDDIGLARFSQMIVGKDDRALRQVSERSSSGVIGAVDHPARELLFPDARRSGASPTLAEILATTAMRCAASDGPILILQDTTEFIYSRAQPGKTGFTKTINAGRYKTGQPNVVTLCGVLMHSSLAVTVGSTPLGLTAAKFWTRTKFKGTWTLKRQVNSTRVPIETKESYRWLENLRQSMALVGTPERCACGRP